MADYTDADLIKMHDMIAAICNFADAAKIPVVAAFYSHVSGRKLTIAEMLSEDADKDVETMYVGPTPTVMDLVTNLIVDINNAGKPSDGHSIYGTRSLEQAMKEEAGDSNV